MLAHELAHIKNRDVLVSTIAAVMAGALALIARMGMYRMMWGGRRREHPAAQLIMLLAVVFAPIAAMLIRMAISRGREFHADATGADISGNPRGLANALEKLEGTARHRPMEVNQGAAHMFIVNPLKADALSRMFSTHPPIQERVNRLRQMR
ncbi:MAG: M48 family metalloprotease [Bacillota bacterium]